MATATTRGAGGLPTPPTDPYSEIESYMRKAEEEISAVFCEGVTGRSVADANREAVPRPRTPARPPPLDGQASPSKIRKVYTRRRTEPSPPRRQVTSPLTRRRVPFIRKPRRVSAPARPHAHNGCGAQSASPWTPRLQEWSQGLLRDFHSLVEEEIRALHSLTPPRRPRPGATHPAPVPRLLNGLRGHDAHNVVTFTAEPRAKVEGDGAKVALELKVEGDGGVPRPTPPSPPVRLPSASSAMGGTQSSSAARGDAWAAERPAFRTYTLPRSGGHRSVSLSGTGAVPYRASAAHPDDSDASCELLRVNPRFSRSHSLDESAGLSPWALHHLSLIDSVHDKPPHAPMTPPATPSQPLTRVVAPEGHYAKIRRQGRSEKQNEQWRTALASAATPSAAASAPHVNGWTDDASVGTPRLSIKSTSDSATASSHTSSLATVCANNGSAAFTPADLESVSQSSWAWADQEDACSLTDRPCDAEMCDHCQARKRDDAEASRSQVSVSVTSFDGTESSGCGSGTPLLGLRPEPLGRKSEPSLFSPPPDAVDGGRRHTLPTPRLYGNLSLLSAPTPTFTTSSWETLPPADELEVELEEKPITGGMDEDDEGRPSSPSASLASSRSLNSSLSSLSHLSVHPDHSECDSWPSSPVTNNNLSPEVFLDPSRIIGDRSPSSHNKRDSHRSKEVAMDGTKEAPTAAHVPPSAPSCTPSPEPITGMLQLAPVGEQDGSIIFSVSIPENRRRDDTGDRSRSDARKGTPSLHDKKAAATKMLRGHTTLSLMKERNDNNATATTYSHLDDKRTTTSHANNNNNSTSTRDANRRNAEETRDARRQRNDNETTKFRTASVGTRDDHDDTKATQKVVERFRSFSLDETSRLSDSFGRRMVDSSSQSPCPEALDDFLRAVESRIRQGGSEEPPSSPPPSPPSLSSPPTSSSAHSRPCVLPTVVVDAFTQTTPSGTPPMASRASSVTWLSDCGCDDLASMEPCASSLVLSATEDDYDDDDDVDDDEDEDDWSPGLSLSSSSSPSPPTPASLTRGDDSSLSLSESLDALDVNGESGIGTVSTRPSASPPSHARTAALSDLSSEDTGLENSFERQIRRFIPRDPDHAPYRRRRPRPRAPEQWVRREDQTTQTDPVPPTPAHVHAEVEEEAPVFRRRPQGRVVRHTHSEPRLDAPAAPVGGALRGVCSEATLPPTSLTPSTPMLPTLTEDKPPIAPSNRPPRPRNLSLSSAPQHSPHDKAVSAPTLEMRTPTAHTPNTPATTPSEDSSGETPILTTRAQSTKEIAELEALEACKWLRAAGFPQYAQMYEEMQFPLDLVCVERDHAFLDTDSLQALFRRLRALNRCAKIRLDSARKNKAEESDDEEQECALSGNWKFQRHSRRWSRVVHDRSPSTGGESKVSGEPRGLDLQDDVLLGQFKRSGSERLRDGAKAILRRMESLKNKKKKRQNRNEVVISGPKLVDEADMQAKVAEMGCVDIPLDASPELSSCASTTTASTMTVCSTHPREARQSTPGEDSSSLASDHSQTSTPLFRWRRRKRFGRRGGSGHGVGEAGGGGGGGGGGGAYSDSECSPPTWRHYFTDANSNKMAQTTGPEKHGSKAGSGRPSRGGQLRHTGSLTYGKESQAAREQFLSSIRGGIEKNNENVSPIPSPDEERHSVYDNVPLIICNKSYHDYQPEAMDSASAHEGSGSSECTVESRDSPLPSTHDDEENEDPCQRRVTVDRWHSFNRKSYQHSMRQLGTQLNGFSSGQMLHLRKRALLRLTALMERYCPTNRSGWNWELPKFMRKMKTPDYRDRQVFGVPLLVIAQRTGQPLPPGIQMALQYLRTSSLDQVGIFRKPGVRSRIQKLRELHESGDIIQYSDFGTCDIADMVKTYFRELPEVLLTNKLSEMFIAIFQYLPVEHRLEALQCAILMLPDENREVLMVLLTFLADVAANSHLNQMHASNLAVCLAPSLFHLNVGTSGSSPLRRRPAGTPEPRDLHENKAAHQCLTLMIQQVSQLQCVPMEMLSNCRFTYLEQSQPVCLEDLGVVGSPGHASIEGDWSTYMNACITSLLKEARDKSRGWVHMNCIDPNVEILYRKVGDGHPLRLWRATTEVEAPPSELLNRVIRERHLWDDSLLKWRVVSRLDRQAEVFQYMCNSMPPRPPVDYCVLRCWRSDLARGTCVVVETSVEHADAPVLVGGVRGIVLASRYLIQPCGSGKSRITHISRLDMRGRTPEWYNKVYGHITASHLTRIRQSFEHHAIGPESKV